MSYPNTWREILKEAETIQKENPDLTAYDCNQLAICYPKSWKEVLKEADLIQKENSDLTTSVCKMLAIGYYNTWRVVISKLREVERDPARTNLTHSEKLELAKRQVAEENINEAAD